VQLTSLSIAEANVTKEFLEAWKQSDDCLNIFSEMIHSGDLVHAILDISFNGVEYELDWPIERAVRGTEHIQMSRHGNRRENSWVSVHDEVVKRKTPTMPWGTESNLFQEVTDEIIKMSDGRAVTFVKKVPTTMIRASRNGQKKKLSHTINNHGHSYQSLGNGARSHIFRVFGCSARGST
jgi:hypothetical protein